MIENLEKWREFAHAGGHRIANAMMVSKGITVFAQTDMFNEDIRKWTLQTTYLKTWANYKTFFHQAHCDQRIAVTTAGKGGYTAAVHKIYSVPPPHPEEYHEAIDIINTIVKGIQMHS